jgi:hypothetical protein
LKERRTIRTFMDGKGEGRERKENQEAERKEQ